MKIRPMLLALVALFSTACGSESLFEANHRNLSAALGVLESDPSTAVRTVEAVVLRTNAEAGEYALQRFFSAYLAAEGHLEAAAHAPFLPETANRKATGPRLGEATASASERPLAVGHLVAAMYHASLALEWMPRAEQARATEDGQALLPEPLQTLGVSDAGKKLLLTQIALFASLRFQDKVASYLGDEGNAALLDFDACQALCERVGLRPWLRAWLNFAVAAHLRTTRAAAAYPFAVTTIRLEPQARGAFPHALVEEMESFVVDNESLEWVCPTCKSTSPPTLERCVGCDQVETVRFTARSRTRTR